MIGQVAVLLAEDGLVRVGLLVLCPELRVLESRLMHSLTHGVVQEPLL